MRSLARAATLAALAASLGGAPALSRAQAPAATPGGASPSEANAPTGFNLVRFVDTQRGWVAGSGGIWATRDGGGSWRQQLATNQPFHALAALSAERAWIAEGQGLLHTADGGDHWRQGPLAAGPLLGLSLPTPLQGWAVAAGGDERARAGALQASTDGGETWQPVATPAAVQDVCFESGQRGWITDGGSIWRTDDGGGSWASPFTSAGAAAAPGATGGPGFTGRLGCVGGGVVWALFQTPGGMMQTGWALYRSDDAGATWTPLVASGQFYPRTAAPHTQGGWIGVSLAAVDATSAYVVGVCAACSLPGQQEQGTVSLGAVRDAGGSWEALPPITDLTGSGLLGSSPAASFADADRGWLVAAGAGRRVFATADGGQSWQAQYP